MPFPIVLAHGIARFDVLGKTFSQWDNSEDPSLDSLHYFKGIRTMLRQNGFDAWHSSVSWAGSLQDRAEQLRGNVLNVLSRTNQKKVNIIAHSMGGLDARRMLFTDRNQGRIHERVAALVTISTPHNGSPAADWTLAHLPKAVPLLGKLGIDASGFKNLTTFDCAKFNNDPEVQHFEAASGVEVKTYSGKSGLLSTLTILKPFYELIRRHEGSNDGLVSVASAMFRGQPHVEVWEQMDHLNELGWWDIDQTTTGQTPHELLRSIHARYLRIAGGLP
jgi:triacylglycerol lipase